MQGRKWLVLSAAALVFAGCSSKELLRADCHSCTVEEQEWKDFSWTDLSGRWRGSVENLKNEKGVAKKAKTERAAEFRFLPAEQFLQAQKISCAALPGNALVMNGILWESGSTKREFEAFLPAEDNKVAYGRLSLEKVNGQDLCQFRRYGRVMGKNRLSLPAVSFSDKKTVTGRGIAAVTHEQDISVEFLRFAPSPQPMKTFEANGRRPAALSERERPPLILRVFRVSSLPGGDRGQWSGTEEFIYRLWKVE